MMLTGSKLKEIQVTLLLSSRAEMQKVIELARQTTVSFIQLSAPSIQPQPPIIPASLSGFLAQQMVQQNQHSPVMQPNIIPEVPIIINDTKKVDVKKSRKSDRDRRSRSKSRDRRRRSRSRDRNFRRRDRSKSKDRRRSRRSKSRERNRSKERSKQRDNSWEKERSKPQVPIVKPLNVPPPILPQNFQQIPLNTPSEYIWDVSTTNNFQGNLPFLNNIPMNMAIMSQMPPTVYKPELNLAPPIFTSNTTFNKYDLPPQIPAIKTNGKAIKISNLEFSTSYSEIRRFFGSLIAQDGIKMINDRNGRRTGCAVILFQQLNAKLFALQKTGQILKNSVILVEDLDENEYFNSVDNFKPSRINYSNNLNNHQSNDDVCIINEDIYENNIFTTLVIEDIPNFTKEQDIIKMFSEITLKDVIIGKKFNELQAYAKFYKTEDAKLALNSKPRHFVGYKKVTVSICSDLAFENAKREFEQIILEQNVEQKYPTDPRQKNRFTPNLRQEENNWNENNETDRNIPDIRSLHFNNFDNENSNFNNQNNNFNNHRNNFNNRNRFNDNNHQNNRRNDNYDNSDDRQFNRSGNFHQRSFNNNFNENRQEFNQRFNDNQSYDNQNDDHQRNFNNDDENKINDHDENSNENSVIVIHDDPTDDDNSPAASVDKHEKIDEQLIIDENIENSMEEIHTEEPLQDLTDVNPNISECIILQNLDSNTIERDVIDFFSDLEIIPVNIHMLLDTENQPSGDCFCEFNNVNDAERALTKNNKNLGPNSIKIEFISRFKVDEIISSFNKTDENVRQSNNQNFDDNHQYQNDFPNFRQNEQNNYNNGNNNYNNGPNNYNNNYRGRGVGGERGGGGGRFNNNNSRNNNNNNNRYNSVPNTMNILNLTNIPYRAEALDILDFFNGFDLSEVDVVRRFNQYGKPSSDAKVIFVSVDEAREAFETCNGKKIGNREIFLKHN